MSLFVGKSRGQLGRKRKTTSCEPLFPQKKGQERKKKNWRNFRKKTVIFPRQKKTVQEKNIKRLNLNPLLRAKKNTGEKRKKTFSPFFCRQKISSLFSF